MILRKHRVTFFRGKMSPSDYSIDFVSENVQSSAYPGDVDHGKGFGVIVARPDDLAPVTAQAQERWPRALTFFRWSTGQ